MIRILLVVITVPLYFRGLFLVMKMMIEITFLEIISTFDLGHVFLPPSLPSCHFFSWHIANLQCCVSFRSTARWFYYIYILSQILFHFIFWPRPSVHGGYPSFPCCVACGIYLSSQTRDQTHISCTGSLNHWTTSKVPIHSFFSSFPRGLYRLLSRIPCAIQEIIFSYDFGSFGLPLWLSW